MDSGNFDEEGLLKNIELSELALKISKLTFGWDKQTGAMKKANDLMSEVRKISLEISEYEQRMGSSLGEYQRNTIYNSMEDLEDLIPYMKKKIKPAESLEIVGKSDNSLV